MKHHFSKKNTESDTTDQAVEESNTDNSAPQRRIQDGISIKNSTRKMNLDRRVTNSERRGSGDANYKGPSRRYTIDRRLTTKDRRKTSDDIDVYSK